MEDEMRAATCGRVPLRSWLVGLLLLLWVAPSHADIFCPPAILNAQYEITAENYNINSSDYSRIPISWSFQGQSLANCNLTTDRCLQNQQFPDRNLSYDILTFGVAAVQLRIIINNFNPNLAGNYSILWDHPNYMYRLFDSCIVSLGSPYDECARNPCVNATSCTDWLVGYQCKCLHGYGGMNCKEGDMKVYCSIDTYNVNFNHPGTACGNIDIDCYVAGLNYDHDLGLTVAMTSNSSITGPSTQVTVSNNNVMFTICIRSELSEGDFVAEYDIQSNRALSGFNFELITQIDDVNTPPRFNTAGTGDSYQIDVLESMTVLSAVVDVKRSKTLTCFRQPRCIQIIDPNFNQRFGIESLTLSVFGNGNFSDIAFQDFRTNDSLGYFYVSKQLHGGDRHSFRLSVTDGGQATATATVYFNIVDANDPPVCNTSEVFITLLIGAAPLSVIGSVTCIDRDVSEQFKAIAYSVQGAYSQYFGVDSTGNIYLNQSALSLNPGMLLLLNVTAVGYSDLPDPAYLSVIPVRVNVTVPQPKCNLSIVDTPPRWQLNATLVLKLVCEIYGVDRLQIVSWNHYDSFDVQPVKLTPEEYGVVLTVKQFLPSEYDFVVTASLGGAGASAGVTIDMFNPPSFTNVYYEREINEDTTFSSSFFIVSATTDTPNATLNVTLKSGIPESLLYFYPRSYLQGGTLFANLVGPVKQYAGTVLRIVIEARDSISNLTTDLVLNVTVKDLNEPPQCNTPVNVTVRSDLLPGSIVTNVTCYDPDVTPEFNTLTYFMYSTPSSMELADNRTGVITLSRVLPPGLEYISVYVDVSDSTFIESLSFYVTVIIIKCPHEKADTNIFFPETPVNSFAVANCSGYSSLYTGRVTRFCNLNQTWGSYNYTDCSRADLLTYPDLIQDLKRNNATSGRNVTRAVKYILTSTGQSADSLCEMLSGDIIQLLEIIVGLWDLVQYHKDSDLDLEDVKNLAVTTNCLIGAALRMWNEVLEDQNDTSGLLLAAVDGLIGASLRTDTIRDVGPIVMENLAIRRDTTADDIFFPDTRELLYQNYSGWVLTSQNTAFLKKEAFLSTQDRVNYAVTLYHNATGKLRLNRDVQSDPNLIGKVLNTDFLSFTLNAEILLLVPPLALSFSILQNDYSNESCGFLDVSASKPGIWSTEGCTAVGRKRDTNGKQRDIIECSCNHLTNFAVLMSPFRDLSETDREILDLISIIGCAISIFFLTVTVLVYAALWKYVKCDRSVLHVNLSVCLILAYVIFLAGVDRTDSWLGCKIVAALMHYIYLVVFCVMLGEGIEMFKSVSFVFSGSILCKLIPFCYGVPLIVVAVSLGITKTEGYGTETSCWLSTEDGLIWAFVGPALLFLLINFIIIIHVLRVMQTSRQMTAKTNKQRARSVIRTICILSPLLGLTWVFGVLSVNRDTIIFQYLFAIFNSLQGLMIFICYCLLAHQVRDGIKAKRRKQQAKSFDSAPVNSYENQNRKHMDSDASGTSPVSSSQGVNSTNTESSNLTSRPKTATTPNSIINQDRNHKQRPH